MITNQEINATKLSYTKKDFYQIYTELLDTARKISERWDPTSTNETDPGIVLLKVLTAVADKINYNIDKNILEAFMPSASQEESMRKLCEMMGYDIKYYQSAITRIVVSAGSKLFKDTNGEYTGDEINIPIFSTIKDVNDEITYTLLNPVKLNKDLLNTAGQDIYAIEGIIEDCKNGDGKIITLENIDDRHRYYLPEPMVAENGIFIMSVEGSETDIANSWNAFNFEDTNVKKNVWVKVNNLNTQPIGSKCWKFGFDSRKGLPYIQFPDDISAIIDNGICIKYVRTSGINGNIAAKTLHHFDSVAEVKTETLESIAVTNPSAAKNGCNVETINQAYNSYKKTIGTFDTLVTCRDYMNKIYQLTDTEGHNLVSNVIVSDLRDDINRSYILTTYDEFGITHKSLPINKENQISTADLIIYPFMPVNNANTKEEFDNSFRYSAAKIHDIEVELADSKAMSHIIRTPDNGEITCIKDYLGLNAKITTTRKINSIEEASIIKNVKTALYSRFNLRNLDFGEEIVFDDILECIEQADARIKNVILDYPKHTIKFGVAGSESDIAITENESLGKELSNNLLIRNILAGRIPMFSYDTSFKSQYNETNAEYYPKNNKKIDGLDPKFTLPTNINSGYTLGTNEVVQFSAPNFKTEITYPAYVRYFVKLNNPKTEIKQNEEYQLKGNDRLYIMYKPADTTDDNGNTIQQQFRTEIYKAGTIIRSNFVLEDSKTVHESKGGGAYAITQAKIAEGTDKSDFTNLPGMDVLGTNQQIEIRRPVIVKLDKQPVNIYWDVQDVKTDSAKIDINYTPVAGKTGLEEYTLKENEYLYYTDNLKADFTVYGKGTRIVKPINIDTSRRIDDTVSYEKIYQDGLDAINWKMIVGIDENNSIDLYEYQYITLAENDSIKCDNSGKYFYGFNGNDANTPLPEFTNLDPNTYKWTIKEFLSLNCGPDKYQTLGTNDKIIINYTDGSEDVLGGSRSFKTNYDLNTTSSHVIYQGLPVIEDDESGKTTDWTFDGKVKSFNLTTPIEADSLLTGYLTSNISKNQSLSLNVSIEKSDQSGLLMVYCPQADVVEVKASSGGSVAFYNSDKALSKLPYGMSILEVKYGTKKLTFSSDEEEAVPLTYGATIDIVNNIPVENLGYYGNADNLKNDIKQMIGDSQFYYNCPIQNNLALNINTSLGEKPTDPKFYFDANNINSKFVIAEIDTNSLKKGITIAEQSKL